MRLSDLQVPAPDGIFALIRAYSEDPRPGKVDLGVGVYRDASGQTPVMAAVKEAEHRLWVAEQTKSYVGFSGDPGFVDALHRLVLGDSVAPDRVVGAATTGGTGAVHHAFSLSRLIAPEGRVWVPAQSWPNHAAILGDMALPHRAYRHLDRATGTLDREGMHADLTNMAAGDMLLLHGCCHNPTGVDLAPEDWGTLAQLCIDTDVLPMVDLAYHGFGDGLDADVAGLRRMAALVPEMLICVSGSKNLGLYRDRAGGLLALCADTRGRAALAANLATLNRLSISFPPDHGARLVTMILKDTGLRAQWETELGTMRARIGAMRASLAEALCRETNDTRFAALARQRGMFSLLPATPEQMLRLRTDHAVYGVDDGRINLAGLTNETVDHVARAVADVLR
ncbi:MAG: aromatic amino acid transaminase [Pseudomonadota bacterium]